MKKYVLMSFLIVWVSLCVLPRAFPFDPYTYLNYLEDLKTAENSIQSLQNQIAQIHNQLQSIQYQARNAKSVSNYQWRNITQLIQQLDAATQQGQAISYSMSNVNQQFQHRYPNYGVSGVANRPYTVAYQNWNATTLDTLRSTLNTASLSASNFSTENTLLKQLKTQGATASGRMQALQVSTEIAAENVNQLQELKRIIITQANAQTAYRAYQVSKDSYEEKAMMEMSSHISTSFPMYQNNLKLGLIPNM